MNNLDEITKRSNKSDIFRILLALLLALLFFYRLITTGTQVDTTHLNTITELRAVTTSGTNVTKFATAGRDGKLVIWDVDVLCSSIAGLKI